MTKPEVTIPTGLPVRLGGSMTPPGKCYLMKNPFDGKWEIVTDTEETLEQAIASGAVENTIRRMQNQGVYLYL